MPRLSIKQIGGAAGILAILAVFFLLKCSHGSGADIAARLNGDTQVKEAAKVLSGLAAGVIVYDRCAKDYQTAPQQVAFVRQSLLPWVEYSLGKAYEGAYRTKYGKPPEASIPPFYQSTVLDIQARAQQNISRAIDRKGCKSRRIRKVFETAEYYRQYYTQGKQ